LVIAGAITLTGRGDFFKSHRQIIAAKLFDYAGDLTYKFGDPFRSRQRELNEESPPLRLIDQRVCEMDQRHDR
jgi:hypothetical protein